MEVEPKSFIHMNPVWREQTNFIIGAWVVSDNESETFSKREQLCARKIADNRFIICCIPFFIYDLALGDEVETEPSGGKTYMVQRVIKPSNHYTFRAWFKEAQNPNARSEVVKELIDLDCLLELYSEDLLGIDAANGEQAQKVLSLLVKKSQVGDLIFEPGYTT